MNNSLYHHGILGQKWGIRRFQNKDGSRTNAGLQHLRETRARDKASSGKAKNRYSMDPNTKALLKNVAVSVGTSLAITAGTQYIRNNGKRLALSALRNAPRLTVSAIRATGSNGANLIKIGSNVARAGMNIAIG